MGFVVCRYQYGDIMEALNTSEHMHFLVTNEVCSARLRSVFNEVFPRASVTRLSAQAKRASPISSNDDAVEMTKY